MESLMDLERVDSRNLLLNPFHSTFLSKTRMCIAQHSAVDTNTVIDSTHRAGFHVSFSQLRKPTN